MGRQTGGRGTAGRAATKGWHGRLGREHGRDPDRSGQAPRATVGRAAIELWHGRLGREHGRAARATAGKMPALQAPEKGCPPYRRRAARGGIRRFQIPNLGFQTRGRGPFGPRKRQSVTRETLTCQNFHNFRQFLGQSRTSRNQNCQRYLCFAQLRVFSLWVKPLGISVARTSRRPSSSQLPVVSFGCTEN
jgi:hypothetical protein